VPLAALYTQEQLEIAAGGADELLHLVDKKRTSQLSSAPCQAFLAEVQEAAISDLYSILQIPFNPDDTTVQQSPFVRQNGVTLGLYWTWHKSTGGKAIPDDVKTARVEAIANLKEARESLRTLATSTEPSSSLSSHQVDRGPWTRRGFGGFC
jgi:hypothetical protein